jgi:mannose-6-phosphate isomerase-like protein (cupin superfamily)
MRVSEFVLALSVTAAATVAVAQQPAAQALKTFSSSADVAALQAKAKADHKQGQAIVTEPILRLAPYNANLEYRPQAGTAAVHIKEAEMFYVIDGSATMVTGGTLVDGKPNGDNITGPSIEGGTAQKLSKGDFLFVPENTPHWVSAVEGSVTFMTLHVPRPVPAGK